MKFYSTKDIRNVVLIGSTRSGKTTLSEAMLYEGKVIDRRGTVEAKNTVSDNAEIEQINQRSVFATPLYAEFMDNKFNIIDAPGADDFVGGAVSAFKVCETAILVINAQQGVEVGTEIFARYAARSRSRFISRYFRSFSFSVFSRRFILRLRSRSTSRLIAPMIHPAVPDRSRNMVSPFAVHCAGGVISAAAREEIPKKRRVKNDCLIILYRCLFMDSHSFPAVLEKRCGSFFPARRYTSG